MFCLNYGSVAELGSERNFHISSEKNEERGGIFKLNLPTSDEFFATEIWELQLNLIRQQTHYSAASNNFSNFDLSLYGPITAKFKF